jgi:hypothetical protein
MAIESQEPPARNLLIVGEEAHGLNATTLCTALWREQKQHLSVARAAQWRQPTLLSFALTHQLLRPLIAGDALYTKVHQKVAPDESQGWPVVLMDRATRFLWDRHCGRQDRQMLQKAMELLCQVSEHTGDLTLLTDGERR